MRHHNNHLGYSVPLEDFLNSDEQSQVMFLFELVYQSNLIENITTNYIETYAVGEEPKPVPELTDHLAAYRYVLENFERLPTQEDIRKLHGMVMDKFLPNAGQYREGEAWLRVCTIHGSVKKGLPKHEHIPELMTYIEDKIADIENKQKVRPPDIWNIHNEFEVVHPFSDGNGRTGRLLLNWLSLKYFDELNVVLNSRKEKYYGAIACYERKFRRHHKDVEFAPNEHLDIDWRCFIDSEEPWA